MNLILAPTTLASKLRLRQARPMTKQTASPKDLKSPVVGRRRQLGSNSETSLPVYHQLHLVLSQRIQEGVYPEGSQFPPEAHLVSSFGVSRVTVRRALAQLEADGLIIRRQGAGTFVAPQKKQRHAPIAGEIDNLITIGLETETRLLTNVVDPTPPPHVCAALGVARDQPLYMLERLRLHRGEPFSYTTLYLRPQEAALLNANALGSTPVISALEQAGLVASTAEQSIGATLADDKAAEFLAVPIGSALIRVRRAVRDQSGNSFLFQRSLYRPDRYEYHMLLTREHSIGQPRWRPIG